ncbi:MAG: glucuronate isomerase [Sedimentisphaerales bacterium]|nr:glucuronate isomerase [Sedimentisphaerales bacterium]
MAKTFITEDFLLQTKTASRLYHEYAERLPIYDYHNHLPAEQIAQDYSFKNLTEVWLAGDHYKWRALRTNGIEEKYITGDATDSEKFEKWAQTVPYTLRNPLYHWTHLELKRYFGINELLNADTAKEIYDACSEMLRTKEFSVRNLLSKANVEFVCTTEGPLDTLEHHKKIKKDGFKIKVFGAYRPDKAFATENVKELNAFIDKLAGLTGGDIRKFDSYLGALRKRHEFFHNEGCRLSDYGLDMPFVEDFTAVEIEKIFEKIRTNSTLHAAEQLKFKSAVLFELVAMDAEAGWVMQLHMGPLRDTNTKMLAKVGPNTGFDSIGDFAVAKPLAKFLDRLNSADKLPKTILYNINPRDNALMATMIGNFQDGSVPGKIQFGSGWWFLDQKQGITDQIEMLSNMGLLSRFVGMTTDSRSFLSFSRHEYFRRILCNILGNDVEQGLLPDDMGLLGQMVKDICHNNAVAYFGMG